MSIKKQEFYEGAALHQISSAGALVGIRYETPFFVLNDHLWVLLKYCTKNRSPWGFTFGPREQTLLKDKTIGAEVVIGLICGGDGIAAVDSKHYFTVAVLSPSPVHIACYRRPGQHYEVCGPDGILDRKVPPSRWKGIISLEGRNP